MQVLPDKDLCDDMLKLVRYKVLFVRREYEVAFPEREELVSENLTEDSFTAWKIAEFIQDLARGDTPAPERWRAKNYPPGPETFLRGIPDQDKKYLRVHYTVLDRYPREKFKYEEQQIRVLEEIRNRIGRGGKDPYDDLLNQLMLSRDLFRAWRENFSRCAGAIGKQMAALLDQYGGLGLPAAPRITAGEITRALSSPPSPNPGALALFAGATASALQVFIIRTGTPPMEQDVPPSHSMRSAVIERPRDDIAYWQRTAESYSVPVDPLKSRAVAKAVVAKQADLHLHAYLDDAGLVSWSSLIQNQARPVHMRAIAFEINNGVLFFKQMLTSDKTPLIGPMPSAPMVQVVKDQFVVAVEFIPERAEAGDYGTCAMPLNFDFGGCGTAFQNLVLKFRNAKEQERPK